MPRCTVQKEKREKKSEDKREMENDDAGLQYVEEKCGAKGRRLLTFFGFVGVLVLLIAHVTSGSDNRLPGDRKEVSVSR